MKNTKMSLSKALAIINKTYGANACVKFSDFSRNRPKLDVISTGCTSLDVVTDIGGFPKGCIVEISGIESGGKTTVALHTIVQAQKANMTCALIDMENAIDSHYAGSLGVNFDDLLFSQPSSGEEATAIAEKLAIAGVDLIVLDSIAALVPLAEVESEMDEQQMGLQARLITKFCRKIRPIVRSNNVCLLLINQLRDKFGTFGWGEKEHTAGGRALKFYCDLRIDVRNTKQVTGKNKVVVGNHIRARVKKNKVGRPFGNANYIINFGTGIDLTRDLFDTALACGVIKKSKGSFVYGDKIRAADEEAFCALLSKKPNTTTTIRRKTIEVSLSAGTFTAKTE